MEQLKTSQGKIIKSIVQEKIEIIPLLKCDTKLFEAAKNEAMKITWEDSRNHKTWKIPKMSFRQYNLYNRGDDPDHFIEEIDIWKSNRNFLPGLKAIPELMKFYFQSAVLQNCRLLTVNHYGLLAGHREPIIGIKGKPNNYKLRFHIPFSTRPKVTFFMNENDYTMKEGWLYLYNQSCWHGVENVLGIKRAHLVFDYYLNDQILDELIAPSLQKSGKKK